MSPEFIPDPGDTPAPQQGKLLRDYQANLAGLPDPVGNPPAPVGQVAYSPPPLVPRQEEGQRSFSVNAGPQQDETRKPFKPFPFALKKTDSGSGFRIWPGRLVSSINQLFFTPDGHFDDQAGIDSPQVDLPANMAGGPDFESTELNWNGDVFLYWETDGAGVVTLVEIRGPDEPESIKLPLDDGDTAKFNLKIGNVPAGAGEIEQIIGSDVFWMGAFVEQDSGSGGSGGPVDPPGSSGGSSMGSGKDSGIVPSTFSGTGYVAWYAMESPDVRFEDVFTDLKIRGRESRYVIDPRFLEGIEVPTLRVVGWAADLPYPLGFRIEGRSLVVVADKNKNRRPNVVNVKFTSIRKGFGNVRFTPMTKRDFDANERRLNLGRY